MFGEDVGEKQAEQKVKSDHQVADEECRRDKGRVVCREHNIWEVSSRKKNDQLVVGCRQVKEDRCVLIGVSEGVEADH